MGPTGLTGATGATGATGPSGEDDVIAANDPSTQNLAALSPFVFADNILVKGSSLTHTEGTPEFWVNNTGVYQVFFHTDASINEGVPIPTNIEILLEANGTAIPGAAVRHSLDHSSEIITLTMTLPVTVTSTPTALRFVATEGGFSFDNTFLTITRLGDAE